jgi:ribosomal protein L12E/L44/L45/RPP1/RPP2
MLILISINLLKGTKGGAPQVHKEQYKWLSTTATKKKKKKKKEKKEKEEEEERERERERRRGRFILQIKS